jgi:hypothetical protein
LCLLKEGISQLLAVPPILGYQLVDRIDRLQEPPGCVAVLPVLEVVSGARKSPNSPFELRRLKEIAFGVATGVLFEGRLLPLLDFDFRENPDLPLEFLDLDRFDDDAIIRLVRRGVFARERRTDSQLTDAGSPGSDGKYGPIPRFLLRSWGFPDHVTRQDRKHQGLADTSLSNAGNWAIGYRQEVCQVLDALQVLSCQAGDVLVKLGVLSDGTQSFYDAHCRNVVG